MFVSGFPTDPDERAPPQIFWTKILFWETFWRLQNFFQIENWTILKEVMAIFAK